MYSGPCHLHSYCYKLWMSDRLVHRTQALKNVVCSPVMGPVLFWPVCIYFIDVLFFFFSLFFFFFPLSYFFLSSFIVLSCNVHLSFLEVGQISMTVAQEKCAVLIGEECLMSAVNLNEITVISQVCSRVPQLLVRYKMDLKAILASFWVTSGQQGAIYPRVTYPASWPLLLCYLRFHNY